MDFFNNQKFFRHLQQEIHILRYDCGSEVILHKLTGFQHLSEHNKISHASTRGVRLTMSTDVSLKLVMTYLMYGHHWYDVHTRTRTHTHHPTPLTPPPSPQIDLISPGKAQTTQS